MRHVKIVATIGPATASPEILQQLLSAGMNVARFNMSHGTQEWHRATIQTLKHLSLQSHAPTAILLDLAGPKIRVGDLPQEGRTLFRDQKVALALHTSVPPPCHTHTAVDHEIPIALEAFPSMLQPGHMVLLDDGHITLRILSYQKDRLICTVLAGGHITSRKGVNFPGLPLDLPGCTEKDFQDLELGIDLQVDYLALSFVRRPQDIHSVKSLLSKRGIHIPVIAKIERPEAVACLSEILEASDGVMIARGDLALELSPEDVPILQKRIIALANRMSKPVITATQMLESMTRHLVPTRAEASDVANAVLDGTDAVMLSAETSTGTYPLETLQVMDRIIHKTESEIRYSSYDAVLSNQARLTIPAAICQTAVSLAKKIAAQAIVVFTESGHTALALSNNRPPIPILACTPSQFVVNRLALVWGIFPVLFNLIEETDQRIRLAQDHLKESGLLHTGQLIVIVTGERLGTTMGTHLIKVHIVA